MRIPVRFIFIAALIASASSAIAQQSPPVRNLFLSPIDVTSDPQAGLKISLTLHKDGRVNEQLQRQCYLLIYLDKQESQIQKMIAATGFDRSISIGRGSDMKPFAEMLKNQELVATLDTQTAKALARQPGRSLCMDRFAFQFSVPHETVLKTLRRLDGFDEDNVIANGRSKWYGDRFKTLVFVPLNNSSFADKVAQEYKTKSDFGLAYSSAIPILYCRPLPYEFNIQTVGKDVVIDIR